MRKITIARGEPLVYDATDSSGIYKFAVNIQGIPLGMNRIEASADRRVIRFQRALTVNGLSRKLWLTEQGKTKGISESLQQLFGTSVTVAVLVTGHRETADEVWECNLCNLTFRSIHKRPGLIIEEMRGEVA